MKHLKIYPANKEHFIKLKEFAIEIIDMCEKIGIKLIAYGSLVFFGYTKNKKINVNDVDFLIPENAFKKIIKVLDKNKIKYNYSKEWHTLQVFKGKLKIELDSRDFWQKDLPNDFEYFSFDGFVVKAVSLNSLKEIYKKASEVSKDNPHGNLRKYEVLNRMK